MALVYEKTFDEILTQILTDYSNLDSSPDVSQGSMPFIQASVLASMVWGLFRFNAYNANQMFVDTADSVNLRKWGAIYDISYLDTDTDATYLNKILRFIRQAPAGGNKQDFEDWALDSANSFYTYEGTIYCNTYATVVDVADGPGTVGVYTIPCDEDIIDGSTPAVFPGNVEELLRIITQDYINTVRPLGMLSASVVSAKPTTQAVTMTVVSPDGELVDTDAIEDAIEAAMNLMSPKETLYRATLTCIALSYGAINTTITVPAADTATDNDEFIRPGTITVSEA